MSLKEPEFLYLALILPSLFGLTLIAEGIHKVLKKESGWISILLGIGFLAIIIVSYFLLFK